MFVLISLSPNEFLFWIPGSTLFYRFRYQWTAAVAGTSWYHSHTHLQRAHGLFGANIVREDPEEDFNSLTYDYDLTEHYIFIQELTICQTYKILILIRFSVPYFTWADWSWVGAESLRSYFHLVASLLFSFSRYAPVLMTWRTNRSVAALPRASRLMKHELSLKWVEYELNWV